jgi:hypothetical protein
VETVLVLMARSKVTMVELPIACIRTRRFLRAGRAMPSIVIAVVDRDNSRVSAGVTHASEASGISDRQKTEVMDNSVSGTIHPNSQTGKPPRVEAAIAAIES